MFDPLLANALAKEHLRELEREAEGFRRVQAGKARRLRRRRRWWGR